MQYELHDWFVYTYVCTPFWVTSSWIRALVDQKKAACLPTNAYLACQTNKQETEFLDQYIEKWLMISKQDFQRHETIKQIAVNEYRLLEDLSKIVIAVYLHAV